MSQNSKFALLEGKKRIWAVASVHGERAQIKALHGKLANLFKPGDGLVYLGNILGRGNDVAGTLEEILSFRRLVILQDEADIHDVVFLRGCQEEMLYKIRHIPFANEPEEVLAWMAQQGIEQTLRAYHTSCDEAIEAARAGMTELSQWMNKLKATMQSMDGHDQYMAALKRAAFTQNKKLLLISANVAPDMPLDAQTDAFWWGTQEFRELDHPYGGFERVVRGYDHRQQGLHIAKHQLCLDQGCGFGGPLVCACFQENGDLVERIEV